MFIYFVTYSGGLHKNIFITKYNYMQTKIAIDNASPSNTNITLKDKKHSTYKRQCVTHIKQSTNKQTLIYLL